MTVLLRGILQSMLFAGLKNSQSDPNKSCLDGLPRATYYNAKHRQNKAISLLLHLKIVLQAKQKISLSIRKKKIHKKPTQNTK